MKAIICEQYGLPETLKFGELPDPVLGPDQVLIQVEACGVNFPDVLIIQNKYQFRPELPFSPGGEVAGKIIALGENVDKFQIGDPVLALCGWGGFAEKVAVDQDRVFLLPKGLKAEEAASTLYTYATAYHALKDRALLKAGERLLVLGAAGGVGLAAVELGKLMDAKVIAAASSEEKLALCRQKGADLMINYESEDLKTRIKELSHGKGVDVIFDPVGGKYTEPALRGIAWQGRYLIVGFAGGDIPKIPMNLPLLKGCSIIGVFWGQFSRLEPKANRENIDQLAGWIKEGKIKQHIGKEYRLEEVPEALQALLERKMLGKGVVVL
ncbi:NADPH:quinone oxidoreductase family protein [Algoriphagus sp. CAU 1675]|uniref:NADPH:quinone oxidoreductase family protein n=1 Tax=Algoriphagus sp. CAU 1675 TaxID=3032597 RepID=UPI0023D9AEFA|nr:NADPH:quinone oxidoreductase family protein [Algoriphagus sp. CAU 1675]MDF2156579.1 NADPH:quinone oxidoreductase family protein [Algoriphagus sp. CAU 1675]